jgi:predicted NACHT family NTPase
MVEKRKRSIRPHQQGLREINQAAANKYGQTKAKQYRGIADDLVKQGKLETISEETVKRFLIKGISDYSELIVEFLGLDPLKVLDYEDSETSSINWHPICHQVLAQQQQQQRIRRKITERGFELNIFVPLGLVERREQQRRTGEVSRDEIYQLEQEVITKEYQHDAFLEEVISGNSVKNKHIAIIGEPGAGKSTLLDKIASWIRDNNQGLPICVALGSLQGKNLTKYLLNNWLEDALIYLDAEQRKEINAVKESLKELFLNPKEKVWLLLDGLDEMVVSTDAVSTIKEQLREGWVNQARVVLTSRLNVWDAKANNPLSNFDTYKTLDFTDEQVEEFIDGWFGEAEKSDPPKSTPLAPFGETPRPQWLPLIRGTLATELKTKIKESRYQNLQRLVKNPLRLSLLCQTWYHQPKNLPETKLPETKARLYERFVREINDEWKPEQHPLNWSKQQEELNQALGKLALRGIDSEARFRLPESLVKKEMGEELFSLAKKIGWLNLVDRDSKKDEPVYAFYHPTFQEYFAAIVIDDWDYFLPRNHVDRPVPDKKYRIFESEWKEVILFWFGRENEDIDKKEKEEFINGLVNFEDGCSSVKSENIDRGFYQYSAYFLAIAGISEFKECFRTKEIVKQSV